MEQAEIVEPCPEWHGAAYRGRADLDDVLVLLGPEGVGEEDLVEARRAAEGIVGISARGLLTLRGVALIDRRLGWIYDDPGVFVAVQHTLDLEQTLVPLRAGAELLAQVAEALQEAQRLGHAHPGPDPADVLIDRNGNVLVAGLVGPFPPSPSFRPPHGEEGETAIAWRLGVFLAHLITGVQPPPASEEGPHEALVRRALIRAMSRPGAVLSDRYGDWMRGLMAWKAQLRPALSTIGPGMRQVADSTGGATLRTWAEMELNSVIRLARNRDPRLLSPPPSEEKAAVASLGDPIDSTRDTLELRDTPTAPEFRMAYPGDFEADDPTIESASAEVILGTARAAVVERQVIPVSVGPPPEAVGTPPRLPRGFLDGESEVEEDSDSAGAPAVFAVTGAVMGVLSVVLTVVAGFLLVYLFWPA